MGGRFLFAAFVSSAWIAGQVAAGMVGADLAITVGSSMGATLMAFLCAFWMPDRPTATPANSN